MANIRAEIGRTGGPWTFTLVPDVDFGTLDLSTSTLTFSLYPKNSTTAALTLTQASPTVTVNASAKTIKVFMTPVQVSALSAGQHRYVLNIVTADAQSPQLNGAGSGVLTVIDPRV
jgi:hypothetical protein